MGGDKRDSFRAFLFRAVPRLGFAGATGPVPLLSFPMLTVGSADGQAPTRLLRVPPASVDAQAPNISLPLLRMRMGGASQPADSRESRTEHAAAAVSAVADNYYRRNPTELDSATIDSSTSSSFTPPERTSRAIQQHRLLSLPEFPPNSARSNGEVASAR